MAEPKTKTATTGECISALLDQISLDITVEVRRWGNDRTKHPITREVERDGVTVVEDVTCNAWVGGHYGYGLTIEDALAISAAVVEARDHDGDGGAHITNGEKTTILKHAQRIDDALHQLRRAAHGDQTGPRAVEAGE